jgi:hypothetical protein
MSEPSSLYVRLTIAPEEYTRWLASPIPHASEFSDWGALAPWLAEESRTFHSLRAQSVGEYFTLWTSAAVAEADGETPAKLSWNPTTHEFCLTQLFFEENLLNMAVGLAALRGVNAQGFILVAPLVWGSGGPPDCILEFRGVSRFLKPEEFPLTLSDEGMAVLRAQGDVAPDDE